MEIDYHELFESVFGNATKEELGCLLRNESVPFEYCERALKRKNGGIGWKNRLLIAKRSDCPMELKIRLCRRECGRFMGMFLTPSMEFCPELLDAVFKNRISHDALRRCWKIPDDVKVAMFEELRRESVWNDSMFDYRMNDFLDWQVSLPDKCLEVVRNEFAKTSMDDLGDVMGRTVHYAIAGMTVPLDENMLFEAIGNFAPWERWRLQRSVMYKMAANPSISDYGLLELRLKAPHEYMNDIEWIIEHNAERRERYVNGGQS